MAPRVERAAPPQRRQRRLSLLGLPYWAYATVILAAPLAILALYSLWQPGFFTVVKHATLSNYSDVVTTGLYRMLILKSLAVGAISAILMVTFGFILAYAITFRLGRMGKPVLFAVALSLFASYLVRVYAWGTILGTNGVINRTLISLHLIGRPLSFLFYGYFAIVVTLVYVYLPIAALVIYGGLQDIDPLTIESARDLGAGRYRRLLQITVPQAMPAIKAAFAFTFILATTDYITPGLVGGTSGEMVGSVINDQFSGGANLPLGAALAFVSVATVFIALGLLAILAKGGTRAASAASSGWRQLRARRAGHPRARQLKAAGRLRLAERFPFVQIITAAILVFLAAPLIVLVIFSFNTSPVPGLPLTGFTFHWYSQIVHVEGFGAALRSTATLVAVSVGCGAALAVPAAFMLVRSSRGAARAAVNAAVYGPVAIPGVVIGVAMLTAANFLTVNLGVLVTALAHVLLVCPYIIFVMRARLVEMDIRIEEAARDLGSGPARVFRDITLPLLLTSLIGAGLLAAAVSLDEILVTNFTIGPGATLPVWILGQIRRGLTPGINALAVMILSASLLMVGGTATILRGNLIAGLRNMR